MRLAFLSPAKVNLDLLVLGKREDGYHEIETILQTVALYDRIFLELGQSGINLVVPDMLPAGAGNLCYEAAAAFYGATGISPALTVYLEKNIPIEAGLGGGSSNAAVVLLGLNVLYGFPLDEANLVSIAAPIGSDVPFFLRGGTARATGRGETIIPLPDAPCRWLRIVKPPFGLSTKEVYQRWIPTAVFKRPLRHNDLEQVALGLCPELGMVRASLLGDGAIDVMLCGSGSAMCGFYHSRPVANASLPAGYREYIVPTLTSAECLVNFRGERQP